ncbi:hypothetical protein JCM10212_003253 [Sporobolomyces blumeae]
MPRFDLYSTGSNSHGHLGLGSVEDYSVYTRVPLPDSCRPVRLACGANHTLLLAQVDGSAVLYGAGSNASGQLGRGTSDPRSTFEEIALNAIALPDSDLHADDYEIKDIAACWETSFVVLRRKEGALRADRGGSELDVLVSLGSNDWGERGCGPGRLATPARVSFTSVVASSGIVVRRIVAGPRHVLALIESVSPSTLSTSPVLVGWGASRHGQLGSDDSTTDKLPKLLSAPHAVALPEPFSPQDVVDLSCGKDHSAVVLRSSSASPSQSNGLHVLLMGSNKHGQLGYRAIDAVSPDSRSNLLNLATLRGLDPTLSLHTGDMSVSTTWNSTFVSVTEASDVGADPKIHPTCSRSMIFAFGSNSHGQLGNTESDTSEVDTRDKDSPGAGSTSAPVDGPSHVVEFPSRRLGPEARSVSPSSGSTTRPSSSHLGGAIALSAGSEHVVAIVRPQSSMPPLPPPSTTTTRIDSSADSTIALEPELWTWGWNEHGNLGLGQGDLQDRRSPTRVDVASFAGASSRPDGSDRVCPERTTLEAVWAGNATSWVLVRRDSMEALVEPDPTLPR